MSRSIWRNASSRAVFATATLCVSLFNVSGSAQAAEPAGPAPDTPAPSVGVAAPAPEPPPDPRVDAQAARLDALELDVLRLQAATDEGEPGEGGELKLKSYSGGQRSLQALNPEISVVSDMFARYVRSATGDEYRGDERSGAFFRVAGLHIQSNLDPFALMKVVAEVTPHGAEIGEAYVTWTSLVPGLSLTAGRFRQELGVVNRWHKHALDQFDHPLMLTVPLGEEGLAQTGLSLHALLPPLWSDGLELTVQLTNGENEQLFSGDLFSVPTGLARLSNYWDLSANTYLELGLWGAAGANHARGRVAEDGSITNEDARTTFIGGADLTVNWEPLERSKYHYFTWRTEVMAVSKQLDEDTHLDWLGAYSYVEYKLDRSWVIGVRGDLVQPFATDNAGQWDVQASPYITWWQSPWAHLRLEYDMHVDHGGDVDHRVILQLVAAVGPHKHDRY